MAHTNIHLNKIFDWFWKPKSFDQLFVQRTHQMIAWSLLLKWREKKSRDNHSNTFISSQQHINRTNVSFYFSISVEIVSHTHFFPKYAFVVAPESDELSLSIHFPDRKIIKKYIRTHSFRNRRDPMKYDYWFAVSFLSWHLRSFFFDSEIMAVAKWVSKHALHYEWRKQNKMWYKVEYSISVMYIYFVHAKTWDIAHLSQEKKIDVIAIATNIPSEKKLCQAKPKHLKCQNYTMERRKKCNGGIGRWQADLMRAKKKIKSNE